MGEENNLRAFENRVLGRIFGPKRDEVTGQWRKLHNDLYCSPNFFRVIRSRRMRWTGHVARVRERERERGIQGFWCGNLRERDHLEDPGVDGRIILRWILMEWDVRASMWLRICESGNETSGSMKCGEFLDWLRAG